MTEPKRFGFQQFQRKDGGGWDGAMVEQLHGPYVRYSDYEALAAELKDSEEALRKCRDGSAIRTRIETKRKIEADTLRARVQELEGREYPKTVVLLEECVTNLQTENTQLREDFSKFYNALCAGITQTAELPLTTQFIFEMDGDDWDAFADTMAALKERP